MKTYTGIEVVFDTNVWLYSVSNAPADAAKRHKALQLLPLYDFGVSAQICQEFYVAATGKLAKVVSRADADAQLAKLLSQPFVPTDEELIRQGVNIRERYQISYWDGAIIAAAERLRAHTVYSEDMQHGQSYGSVRVINPFL